MSKTQTISKGFTKKITTKLSNGNFESEEHHASKTIELEDGDIEQYEVLRLSKDIKDIVNDEFKKTTTHRNAEKR